MGNVGARAKEGIDDWDRAVLVDDSAPTGRSTLSLGTYRELRMFKYLLLSALLLAALAHAADPTAEELRQLQVKLMVETQVVAVPELKGPASEYKSDGDPNTLEIVFLKNKQDGPSRVSDDGEVIFLYKASEKEQQKLIEQAFKIRALRRLKGI